MNYLTNILSIFVLCYFVILVSTYIFQRNLLYHPKINNNHGHKLSATIEKIAIITTDNIELLSWYHNKNPKTNKTLLFLHGNAGSLENRIEKLNHFGNMQLNFLIVSWRGFNGNKGKPTEIGLYEDAKSASDILGIKRTNTAPQSNNEKKHNNNFHSKKIRQREGLVSHQRRNSWVTLLS